MADFSANALLQTDIMSVWDVVCAGNHRHESDEEVSYGTHLVFPYRGVYRHHVGRQQALIDANQLLFINRDEGYRVSHPVPGGDSSLSIEIADPILEELAPPEHLRRGSAPAFIRPRLRIGPRAQTLSALLRHRLRQAAPGTLAHETMTVALAAEALGAPAPGGSAGRQRMVDRAKAVLAIDLGRRWSLAEIAAEVGGSPVYLTQVFTQVEGTSLYRYQLQLRLARALELVPRSDDLTMTGLDLGFSSHSHFTHAFRRQFGATPTAYRAEARRAAS